VPALALAGAPLTSGAAAKTGLKYGLGELGAAVLSAGSLDLWLTLAAVGTTLLMARVLYLLASDEGATHGHLSTGLVAPWAGLVVVVAVMAWMPGLAFLPMSAAALTSASLWAAVWPVAAGGGVAWFAWSAPAAASWRARLHVPAGDLVWPVMAGWERVVRAAAAIPWAAVAQAARDAAARARWPRVGLPSATARLEQALTEWTTAGVLLVLMTVIFVFLLVR
jgi:hydrogenase-4 component B